MQLIRFNQNELVTFGLNPFEWEIIPLDENDKLLLLKNLESPELEIKALIEEEQIKDLEWII